MIERALLLRAGQSAFSKEEQLVAEELEVRGIPFESYSLKQLRRRQVSLSPSTLVVGDTDCVYSALKQLDVPIPNPDSYPKSLQNFLHRRVWKSTLGTERIRLVSGGAAPIFMKPNGRQKCFTGGVFENDFDIQRVGHISRHEPVHCSEIVDWVSEFRVYVVNREIRSIDFYSGDPDTKLDVDTVGSALRSLHDAEEGFSGFGIDFGVLSSGETALIEMNDGFALGAYEEISRTDYTDLLIARWIELMQASRPKKP